MQTPRSLIDHPVSRKNAAVPALRREGRRAERRVVWQSDRLAFIHNELVLMTLQTREIQDCDDQMRQAADGDLDMQRGLLHLYARMEGLLEQLEGLIEATEHLMKVGAHLHN